jgi:PBP1b-binding outer membrane lipoprotein LpoB
MKKMKKLACAVFAVVGISGCASNQVAELATPDAAPAQATEHLVSRPLPSYTTLGGYRVRRFAAVAVAG